MAKAQLSTMTDVDDCSALTGSSAEHRQYELTRPVRACCWRQELPFTLVVWFLASEQDRVGSPSDPTYVKIALTGQRIAA